jgi:hypothetical protein
MVMIATAIPPDANYSPRCVPIVARKLKYRSSPVREDQCIAVIATEKSDMVDK